MLCGVTQGKGCACKGGTCATCPCIVDSTYCGAGCECDKEDCENRQSSEEHKQWLAINNAQLADFDPDLLRAQTPQPEDNETCTDIILFNKKDVAKGNLVPTNSEDIHFLHGRHRDHSKQVKVDSGSWWGRIPKALRERFDFSLDHSWIIVNGERRDVLAQVSIGIQVANRWMIHDWKASVSEDPAQSWILVGHEDIKKLNSEIPQQTIFFAVNQNPCWRL